MNEEIQSPPVSEGSQSPVLEQNPVVTDEITPKKSKKLLFLIIGVVILLIVAIFIFFQFKKNNTINIPSVPTPSIYETPLIKITPTVAASPTAAFVPDQLIIKYKSGQTPEDQTSQRKAEITKILDQAGVLSQEKLYSSQDSTLKVYYVLKFKKGTSLEDAKKIINTIPEIVNAEQNNIIHTNN
jgi:hypothetical protein